MSKGTGSGIVKPPAGLTAAGVPTVAAAKAAAPVASTLASIGQVQLKDVTLNPPKPPKPPKIAVQAKPAATAAASSSPTGSIQGNAAAISQKYIKEATKPHYPLTKQSAKLTKSLGLNKKEQEMFSTAISTKMAEIEKKPSNVDQLKGELSNLLVAHAISKAVGGHISDKKKNIDKALAQIDKANKKASPIPVAKAPSVNKAEAVAKTKDYLKIVSDKGSWKLSSAQNLLHQIENEGGFYKQGVWVPVGTFGPAYEAVTKLVKKDIAKYSTQATKEASKKFVKDKAKAEKIHAQLTKVTTAIQSFTNSQGINTANKSNQTKLQKLTTKAQSLLNQISSLQTGTVAPVPTSVLNAINQAEAAILKQSAGYKTFSGTSEANAELMHKYANFGATDAEKSALKKYTGNGYATINSKLRAAGGDSYAATSMTVKALDSVIKRAPVTDIDMKLRRDFSFGPMFTHIEKYGTLNGTVMTDRGFSSTSARMNWIWSGGFKATILLPKGSQGIYTGGTHDYSSHPGESEFILPRETRYKIVSTKKSGSYTELVMEAYTPNHPKYHTITPGFGHKGNEY
jgi:hypothetical protein